MTTIGSIKALADHPELLAWSKAIEIAAGPEAWTNIQVFKVDGGKIESIRVTCTMKCREKK